MGTTVRPSSVMSHADSCSQLTGTAALPLESSVEVNVIESRRDTEGFGVSGDRADFADLAEPLLQFQAREKVARTVAFARVRSPHSRSGPRARWPTFTIAGIHGDSALNSPSSELRPQTRSRRVFYLGNRGDYERSLYARAETVADARA